MKFNIIISGKTMIIIREKISGLISFDDLFESLFLLFFSAFCLVVLSEYEKLNSQVIENE